MDETKISPATWKTALRHRVSQPPNNSTTPERIAVIGVGNEMRSDDAAGILVARALSKRSVNVEHLLIIEAGQAPENWTGELRKFEPVLVIFVDAADTGGMPGSIQWIPEDTIDGMSASTHSLPLSLLAHFLRLELNCEVKFMGIQPDSIEVGEEVSPDVLQAIEQVVQELAQITDMRDR